MASVREVTLVVCLLATASAFQGVQAGRSILGAAVGVGGNGGDGGNVSQQSQTTQTGNGNSATTMQSANANGGKGGDGMTGCDYGYGWHSGHNDCYPCGEGCGHCKDDCKICTQCKHGYYYSESEKCCKPHTHKVCKYGYGWHSGRNDCYTCGKGCGHCKDDCKNCTQCKHGYYYSESAKCCKPNRDVVIGVGGKGGKGGNISQQSSTTQTGDHNSASTTQSANANGGNGGDGTAGK